MSGIRNLMILGIVGTLNPGSMFDTKSINGEMIAVDVAARTIRIKAAEKEYVCRIQPLDTKCHFAGHRKGLTMLQLSKIPLHIPVRVFYPEGDELPDSDMKAIKATEVVLSPVL